MKDKDQIKELFSDKLGNFEANVNPALWENIASQVAAQSTAATGMSLLAKLIIGAVSAAAITGLVIYGLSETSKIEQKQKEQVPTSKVELVDNKELTEEVLQVEKITKKEKTEEILVTAEEITLDEFSTITREEPSGDVIFNEPINTKKEIVTEQEVEKMTEIVDYSPVENKESTLEKETTAEPQEETKQVKEDEVVVENATVYSIEKMPNVFSPNNDGKNDIFFINSTGLSDFNLVVMDENNKTVFQTADPSFKWNGTGMDGLPISKGRYVYFLTAKDENGNPVNKYSSLVVR